MNFVDYTKKLINDFSRNSGCELNKLLVVGSEFKLDIAIDYVNIERNDPTMDLNDWMMFRRNNNNKMFDGVILSRVLEHFPIRHLDWYLYNLYTIMAPNSKLICIVPDMAACAKELELEFKNVEKHSDMFRTNRLTYELLSEGNHVWDRHATWTSEKSVKFYLEMEDLFEVKKITKIEIDSTIVPKELEFIARRK